MPGRAFGALGEQLTKSLLDGDFASYASIMALPLRIAPRGELAYVMQTEAELRTDFELYHANLVGRGVTDIFRQVLDITPMGSGQVRVHCRTHIMVRAQRIVEPFETVFLLNQAPDGWRISEVESSVGHIRFSLGRSDITAGAFVAKPDSEGEEDGEA